MKVYVAIPNTGWIRYEVAETMLEIGSDGRYGLYFHPPNPLMRPLPCAKHHIINKFLETDADYLLNMDSDAVPYHNPLDLVELDLDIVAMACPVWSPKANPPIILNARPVDGSTTIDMDAGPLLEVTQTSTSVILIARRVLEHPAMVNPFAFQYDERGITAADDDITFYRKARENGFRIWVSLDHVCGHVKEVDVVEIHNAVAEWRQDALDER
jgi:hypothetical protein